MSSPRSLRYEGPLTELCNGFPNGFSVTAGEFDKACVTLLVPRRAAGHSMTRRGQEIQDVICQGRHGDRSTGEVNGLSRPVTRLLRRHGSTL